MEYVLATRGYLDRWTDHLHIHAPTSNHSLHHIRPILHSRLRPLVGARQFMAYFKQNEGEEDEIENLQSDGIRIDGIQ